MVEMLGQMFQRIDTTGNLPTTRNQTLLRGIIIEVAIIWIKILRRLMRAFLESVLWKLKRSTRSNAFSLRQLMKPWRMLAFRWKAFVVPTQLFMWLFSTMTMTPCYTRTLAIYRNT